jgi:hypothetical protein
MGCGHHVPSKNWTTDHHHERGEDEGRTEHAAENAVCWKVEKRRKEETKLITQHL